jgi:hypothetical protein
MRALDLYPSLSNSTFPLSSAFRLSFHSRLRVPQSENYRREAEHFLSELSFERVWFPRHDKDSLAISRLVPEVKGNMNDDGNRRNGVTHIAIISPLRIQSRPDASCSESASSIQLRLCKERTVQSWDHKKGSLESDNVETTLLNARERRGSYRVNGFQGGLVYEQTKREACW